MNWLAVVLVSFSVFFENTLGRLEACYECSGNSSSACGDDNFNTSSLYVGDCLEIYRTYNTTDAVCIKLIGHLAESDASLTDVIRFARACVPKNLYGTDVCELVTSGKADSFLGPQTIISTCTTCTSDFCNASPTHLTSVAPLLFTIFATWTFI